MVLVVALLVRSPKPTHTPRAPATAALPAEAMRFQDRKKQADKAASEELDERIHRTRLSVLRRDIAKLERDIRDYGSLEAAAAWYAHATLMSDMPEVRKLADSWKLDATTTKRLEEVYTQCVQQNSVARLQAMATVKQELVDESKERVLAISAKQGRLMDARILQTEVALMPLVGPARSDILRQYFDGSITDTPEYRKKSAQILSDIRAREIKATGKDPND